LSRPEPEPWQAHPLAHSLRCVACSSPEPLLFEENKGNRFWHCRGCDRKYEHSQGIPVLVAEESLPPEERYSEFHPVPFKRLRRTSPRVFGLLKKAYLAASRAEALVTPRTALDPAFHLKRLKRDLPLVPERVVLDVGGGTAPYRDLLDGRSDTWVVLEKDRNHTRELSNRGTQADYLVGAAEAIPLLDSSCHLVVLTEVLEHCRRPAKVLAEIARVLKPGGHCIGTVPQYWHVHGWPSDYFRYTNLGLEVLSKEAGLDVLRMEPKGGPLLLLWSVLDLTTCRWSRTPGISLLLRVPTLWIAWGLDRLVYRNPKRMVYPDTAGWAFLLERSTSSK
jgi:SAM-dependent methyltransferase